MGPLAGVKVLEFEAVGPVPFCGMMLADMGADVLLVDRPSDPGLGLERERWYDVMLRGRRSVTLDLKSADGCCRGAGTGAQGRRRAGRLPARRDGASGAGSRRAARRQSEARRRPHDRLGAGRSAGAARRARPQLHRDVRRPACDRPRRRRARAAAQPGRRLRRRRHAARVRRGLRDRRGAALGTRAGGRRRHGGRRVAAGDDVLGHARRRQVERRARRKHPRHRRAVVRRLSDAGRQVRRHRRHRAQVLRRAAGANGSRGRGAAAAARARTVAGTAAALCRGLRRQKPRRLVCRLRRVGRVLLAGADVRRGPRSSAQRRPPRLHDTRRRRPARARAAFFAHAGRGESSAARARRGGAQALADWGFTPTDIERLRADGVGFAE